jgi:hypothetical protein
LIERHGSLPAPGIFSEFYQTAERANQSTIAIERKTISAESCLHGRRTIAG